MYDETIISTCMTLKKFENSVSQLSSVLTNYLIDLISFPSLLSYIFSEEYITINDRRIV